MALNPPYDTPLIMQSAHVSDWDGLCPAKPPIFLHEDSAEAKVVLLRHIGEGVVVIRSATDGQELIVSANGGCFFESPMLGIGEEFKLEAAANGSTVFVSCRTGNVLESDTDGHPRCVDTIRRGWFLVQHDVVSRVQESPVMVATPVLELCERCKDSEAKERREYILKLLTLGKSMDEIDAILLRMYEWQKITRGVIPGGGSIGNEVLGTSKLAAPKTSAWQWMKPE
ncbi:unnamed protein product [Phytophthora lilii]|uniref:Unnamed protein product n=1 Tax=Phytophthora lilii TaxID=2077276 RepID=A0A9W6UF67_9STRA|nr:unnamed protein product [Phytophthora lilii]